MTQYAKRGTELFYGRDITQEILPGKYECIGCPYIMVANFTKEGIFSHFSHETNSRAAHMATFGGELCPHMTTNFTGASAKEREEEYTENTMKQLLDMADRGELSPADVVGHLRLLGSLIQNRVALTVRESTVGRKEKELDERVFSLKQKEYALEKREAEIDEQERALNRLALHRNTVDERGSSLIKKIKNRVQAAPPFRQEEVLEITLSDLI